MIYRMDQIFSCMGTICKSLSPKISLIQNQFEFAAKSNTRKHLIKACFMNNYLCKNTRSLIPHTECDASYTVITVPGQEKFIKGNKSKKNRDAFDFFLKSDSTKKSIIVLNLHKGVALCYSGYLLTHRQWSDDLSDSCVPFLNIVSHNSKRLFENIMIQSFRRYIES